MKLQVPRGTFHSEGRYFEARTFTWQIRPAPNSATLMPLCTPSGHKESEKRSWEGIDKGSSTTGLCLHFFVWGPHLEVSGFNPGSVFWDSSW